MPLVDCRGGVRIHYEVHGSDGPFVVLIQGLGLSSRFWFDVPERLARAGHGPYRVITLDNRGAGRSGRPRGLLHMRHLADDVRDVLDAAGADAAYVVGISLGGMIAQHVALEHPDRVRGLALLATMAGLPHGRLPGLRVMATLMRMPFGRASGGALASLLLPPAELHRARQLFAHWPAAMRADPVELPTFLAQLGAVALHSTGRRLHKLRCPTVVITGAEDVLVPPGNSEVLARLIPGATLEVLPGVGHAIPLLDPHVVDRAVAGLRARTAAPPAA